MTCYAQAAELIRRGKRFLLTCHVLPDPDAVGSMLGLAEILRGMGKDVFCYNRDPLPDSVAFLPGADAVVTTVPHGVSFDATLVTDTAARNLLPRSFPPKSVTGPVIIVDHHLAHDDYGDLMVRDVEACATAMVVLELARELGVNPVPPAAALPLYTAIVADTGGFRYPGTTAETLRTAADLMDAGIDPWQVASNVFENWPMSRLRLLGYAINALETEYAGRVAILSVPLAMVERAGASERMVEGMVEYGRMLGGVEISIMLWERRPRSDETDYGELLTRLSLRSSGGALDVAAIAAALGGGGHRTAAGATLTCGLREARELVLAEAGRMLGL
ncbi:MAG: DHH family phosphoesterase [Myxococcales bacterium]|nr:DHH family phosphoesterase [Myxococcales bacterium]MDD9968949.1 DHH family phosphoesterase [Myxococcales bacterium]